MAESLEFLLDHARERLVAAQAKLTAAEARREHAREMGGGLLSFGGSGSQRAHQQVQSATGRALRDHLDASEKVEYWERMVRAGERRIAERDRVRLTREDLVGATHVRLVDGGWWRVAKVNRTTVSVVTGYSWTNRHEFSKIAEARTVQEPIHSRPEGNAE